jgi:hypothetical protein
MPAAMTALLDPALDTVTATALLGVDTLWGGDVLDPSGAGRTIADAWCSDLPLPPAYTHPAAAALRASGGLAAPRPDAALVDAYLAAIDVRGAIEGLAARARALGGLRGAWLAGLADSLLVTWDLGQEVLGRGPAVPYERCVLASCGRAPSPSRPEAKRERLARLLSRAGHGTSTPAALLEAVDAWRRARLVRHDDLAGLGTACIAQLDALALRNLVPHLPRSLREVPRANVTFLPITGAWFSGSMNYLGRARNPDGSPQYEATYEVNASLEISAPELLDLVAHEVVPGHVTTFALAQALHVQGALGFEATVLAMNTRHAALSEGIANNALLMAFGVTEVEHLPDEDLQVGKLLSLLQDDAKNQASWLTWAEGRPQAEVAAELRRDYLVSAERADKLSGAWGRNPLSGRTYLPAYRAGTEKVAALRARHPPERVLPALFCCGGMVDLVTIDAALSA